jgi:ectoine hydroxylase-related dioxygenase (phytanoyl-CoA dioxygenase family)
VIAELERDGFVVIPGALRGSFLRRVLAATDRVWAAEAPGETTLHRLGFVGLDPVFLELLDHPAAFPLVHAMLGWNIHLYHCHLDVHPPRWEPARWRWHQDGGRQNVELESPRPRLSLKVAYFLTDVPTAEHGAMRVVPGSHHADTLPTHREPADARPLLVRAGSAVVFDRRLWHARGDNHSDTTRKALFYGYTYRWIRPRDELALEPSLLARVSSVRRQLLGAATGVSGHWLPQAEDVPLRDVDQPRWTREPPTMASRPPAKRTQALCPPS